MKKMLFILFLYYPIHAYTQGWSIDYSIGYSSYQLDDIRNRQHSMLNIVGLKETDRFPNYITHSVSLGFVTGRSHFGSNFSYFTTGGRLNRSDYSGSYTVDMIMNGYRLGPFYRYYINSIYSPLSVYLQLGSGVMFSSLKMEEKVHVYSESSKHTSHLNGVGIYLEPTIGASYRLTDRIHFSLGGGYEADLLGKLKLSGHNSNMQAHWNGLRLYGGITYILPTKKTTL